MIVCGALLASLLGPVRVSMPARADCPAVEAVERDISTLLGGTQVPQVDVRIEIREEPSGVVAVLSFDAAGRTQARRIPGATCAEVVDAAADCSSTATPGFKPP